MHFEEIYNRLGKRDEEALWIHRANSEGIIAASLDPCNAVRGGCYCLALKNGCWEIRQLRSAIRWVSASISGEASASRSYRKL